MLLFRVMGLFAVIPVALLLTVSFFVLLSLRKNEKEGALRAFGYCIVALLWIGAALILSAGSYTVATGRHPMAVMMREMMKCKMQGLMPDYKQGMVRPDKQMIKDKSRMMMPQEVVPQ